MFNQNAVQTMKRKNYPVQGHPFFPEVTTRVFVEIYRIPVEFSDDMIVEKLTLSVLRVNKALMLFREGQERAGFTVLSDVPGEIVNRETEAEILYRRAVYCEAMADVMRESPTFFRRKEAENATKSSPETEAHYRALSKDAIRRIKGRDAVYVEMI